MVHWTHRHVFNHEWETVVEAAWKKYPNPINPAVTAVDVVNRNIDNNGVLHSSRVLGTHWNIPNWVTKLIGLDNPSFGFEKSEVDPSKREMILRSRNLNCTNFVTVDERLVYKPDPNDSQKTVLEQETILHMHNVPFVTKLEKMMANAFQTQGSKGPECVEWVIDNLKREYTQISSILTDEYSQLSTKFSDEVHELSRKLGDISHSSRTRTPS